MFFKKQISEGVRMLADQITSNPHDWVQQQYHFRNMTNTDIALWTANGVGCLQLEGNKGFSKDERIHLNAAIQKSIALKLMRTKRST